MRLEERIKQVEAHIGRPLVIRSVHTDDEDFRGRVQVRGSVVVIEYTEELPGYFWGYELLEKLLDYVEQGGATAIFHQGGPGHAATSD